MKTKRDYDETTHFIGRLSCIAALIVIFAVPTVICTYYDIWPPAENLLKGLGMVCVIYIPVGIAEALTYIPMLGSGASYLVFVTGNLTNLKIPCTTMCMEITGVEAATDEGEVISTIAVAMSTIVTEIVIVIGVLALVPLKPVLELPVLQPAFQNILPALFGALGTFWVAKQWKLALVPLGLVFVLSMLMPSQEMFVFMMIAIPPSILAGRIMYKKGWIKE
jgi:hypothetical protein